MTRKPTARSQVPENPPPSPTTNVAEWLKNLVTTNKDGWPDEMVGKMKRQIAESSSVNSAEAHQERSNNLVVIQTEEALEDLSSILTCGDSVIDVITTTDDAMVGIAILHNTHAYYIPVGHLDKSTGRLLTGQLPIDDVIQELRLSERRIIAHDAKQVLKQLNSDLTPQPIVKWDTMLGHVFNNDDHLTKLGDIASKELDVPRVRRDDGNDEVQFQPIRSFADRAARRCRTIELLSKKQMAATPSSSILPSVEFPLVPVVAAMEQVGYMIDHKFFKEHETQLNEKCTRLRKELSQLTTDGTAPESDGEVREFLFDTLELEPIQNSKTGKPSVDAESLRHYSSQHQAVPLIIELRQCQKMLSTYVSNLTNVEANDRLRSTLNQLGTSSGRFTINGIIHTIPRDDAYGIRRGFIVPRGYTLVMPDYRQQEICVLAGVSKDQPLLQAVNDHVDLHGFIAKELFGLKCNPNEVKTRYPEERTRAKLIQLGIIYGRTPFSLARDLKISEFEAEEFIEDYFTSFPGVRTLIAHVRQQVVRDGTVTDVFGRQRHLPDAQLELPEYNDKKRREYQNRIAKAKRAAQNFFIQAPAATITKLAMIQCHQRIQEAFRGDIRMILTLHDELHFEVHNRSLEAFINVLPDLMCDLTLDQKKIDIPLSIEIKTGKNWADAKVWGRK